MESLQVEKRDGTGKKHAKRLRETGKIPANIYGHGEKNVNVTVATDAMQAAVRHGAQLIKLQGAVRTSALIREIQWDPFGNDILHVDFTRVSTHERITVTVPVELRGDAPGTHEGGTLDHLIHQLEVECEAGSIPESLQLSINDLHIGQSLTVADLPIPEGVTAQLSSETPVVQCMEKVVTEEEELAPASADEPEIIGRQAEEEEETNE